MTIPAASLRARIRAGETVIGTFVKTPAPHIVEVLGLAGLDLPTGNTHRSIPRRWTSW